MTISYKKIAAFIVAAALSAAAVSCSSSDTSDEQVSGNLVGSPSGDANIKENDMPYGATFTSITSENSGVVIEYDYRYITEEEAIAVSDYFISVSSNDPEMLESTVYPEFLQYTLELIGAKTAQDYIDTEYDGYKYYIGDDFVFNYLIINDLQTEGDFDFSGYDQILHELSPDAEISGRKMVYTECLYKTSETGGSYSYHTGSDTPLCLYTIDGKAYVLPA